MDHAPAHSKASHAPHAPSGSDGHGHDGRHQAPALQRSWLTLAIVAIAQFMVILDVTVVNVALPTIGESLHFSGGQLQWVVSAYVLFTGGLMLLGGRMADLIGRKPVFMTGLGLFTGASLISGLAWSPTVLIAGRALQGVGAAMLLPSALSIITTTYEGPQRAKALAIWGALGSAGAAAGVLFGGIITQWLGWEAIFFINVPIGIAVAVLATASISTAEAKRPALADLDLPAAGALMAGLVAVVLAIQGTSEHGWLSVYTAATASAAIFLLGWFTRIERSTAKPLIPTAIWRNHSLISSAAIMLTSSGMLVGAFFLNTIYLQRVMEASPLETGLAFLPLALVILAGAHTASHFLPRFGSRWIVVGGMLLTATGASLLAGAPADPSYIVNLLPGYLLLGFGIGMSFVSVSVTAMSNVSDEYAGLASGLMTTAHELGAAIGVAVLAAVASAATHAGSVNGIVDGYQRGFIMAGSVAAAVALVAAVALPSLRPQPGMAHGMH